ncbi:nucleoside triphosphate pyrophosphohydrolase [Palleronia sediminis]|uniref:Nucleoside triphosphate pyrophosphohydrolase n=1 Tax=Palleronia sediminis TaxID=2547833 RepID=A0A4R6AE48_9RHOB|nr:nucleoside triphosphate pyrophosphohydrolase [Palleronia sediminis]TDL79483.1 nucleoside triphosphate pyrophosphohydrolase [Palleronia sediminis]
MADPTDPIFEVPAGLDRLRAVMARLRDPEGGCPWDLEQDFASIAPYTIEEAYEVADAIERGDMEDLKSELGDLLFQPVYHAQMAAEAGAFELSDVIAAITDKMIDRHPHVFGADSRDKSAAQQTADWEARKAAERGARGTLDGVALGLPALLRAAKLQRRAARVGFDWADTAGVLDKIAEEAAEVAAARNEGPERLEHEIGDLLFTLVNLARHLGVEPETALRGANARFTRRFEAVEAGLAARGRSPAEADLPEMEALWREAKARGL